MKVELEKIHIGINLTTKEVFAGILDKTGNKWLKKTNISNMFMDAVLNYFLPKGKEKTTTVECGSSKWEINVKKIA